MSYEGMLDEVCILSRPGNGVQNAGGEELRLFTVYATDAKCSVQSPAGGLAKTDGGKVSREVWAAFVMPSVGAQEGDRLAARGLVFEVKKAELIRGRVVQLDLRRLPMAGLP